MARDRRHIILSNLGKAEKFKAKVGGSPKRPSDVPDRASHAQSLLRFLDNLPDTRGEDRSGVYLTLTGRRGEEMVTKSLNSSGMSLLRVVPEDALRQLPASATVFATPEGVDKLRKKVDDFQHKETTNGRPRNADLIQSIATLVEAGLRQLWKSPQDKFPVTGVAVAWEVWLEKDGADDFIRHADTYGIVVSPDRLEFPEDVVILLTADQRSLAEVIKRHGTVRALASPTTTADFFDCLPAEEQPDWADSLLGNLRFTAGRSRHAITILDTGISLGHPLIAPALDRADRHAARPEWGLEDTHGHGTQLAGLCLYGDMTHALQSVIATEINYRLESVKIIPDAGANPHHLLGAITRSAINAVEANADRHRTFSLASTTEDDTPHDGAPTSWSSTLDQLASGNAGIKKVSRLIVVSAGNSDQNRFQHADYLSICDDAENEIESPAQAWNTIAVGAYTTKCALPAGVSGRPYAPAGDLSPSSRTASWASYWPIKPDVVMEGANWLADRTPPPLRHGALSLLTTDHTYPARTFTLTHDTRPCGRI